MSDQSTNHWVIPDIHGHAKTLTALLDQISPSKDDLITFLGDYIDRGPNTKGVLDILMKMEDDGFNVRFLRGNHEDYMLRSLDKKPLRRKFFQKKDTYVQVWHDAYWKSMLESFGISAIYDLPLEYIRFLNNSSLYFEDDNYIYVHAGLNFEKENPFEDEKFMLWTKEFSIIPEKIQNRKIIHGHVPVSLDLIEMSIEKNTFHFIDLDNGVYMKNEPGFGNLVALNLLDMELKVQKNVDG